MKKGIVVCVLLLISIISFGQAPIGSDSTTQIIKGVAKINTGIAMPIVSPGAAYKRFWGRDTVAILYVDSATHRLMYMRNGVVDTVVGNGSLITGEPIRNSSLNGILFSDASQNLNNDPAFLYYPRDQLMALADGFIGKTGDGLLGFTNNDGSHMLDFELSRGDPTFFGTMHMSGFGITGIAVPSDGSDAVNKAYVDALSTGLSWKSLVRLATVAALSPSPIYNNGTAGVGATLTGVSVGVLTIDGRTVALNDRVLIQNESAQTTNGIYLCTTAGTLGVAYVLTRATDANTGSLLLRATVAVSAGATDSNRAFTQITPATITIGSSNITFVQFLNNTYAAGTGLTLNGNIFNISDIGTSGTFGGATQSVVFATNAQGQVISAESVDISGTPPGGTAGGDLTGTYPNPTLAVTAVASGSYGSATQVGTFTVDAKGRLTAAANTTISGTVPGGSAGGDLTGTYPNPTIKSSVVLVGSPTTTTQTQGDNSNKIATTAYADARIQTVTTTNFATSYTINSSDSRNYQLSITAQAGTLLFNNPTGTIVDNQLVFIKIKSASAQTLSWGSQFSASSDGPPLPTTTNAGKWMYLLYAENTTSNKWYLISFANNF